MLRRTASSGGRTRDAAPALDEHVLEPANRPYDLRRAGISFWLAPEFDPAECARRAGQSIQVLFRHHAKFQADARNRANGRLTVCHEGRLTGDLPGQAPFPRV